MLVSPSRHLEALYERDARRLARCRSSHTMPRRHARLGTTWTVAVNRGMTWSGRLLLIIAHGLRFLPQMVQAGEKNGMLTRRMPIASRCRFVWELIMKCQRKFRKYMSRADNSARAITHRHPTILQKKTCATSIPRHLRRGLLLCLQTPCPLSCTSGAPPLACRPSTQSASPRRRTSPSPCPKVNGALSRPVRQQSLVSQTGHLA